MKPPISHSFLGDDRAVSEVLGWVLLVGMALLGAVLVVTFGSAALDEVRNQNTDQTAEIVMQEVDSRMGSLSQVGDVPRAEFDLGDTNPGDVSVVHRGYINVTANRNTTCSTQIPLSSMQYQGESDQIVAYEAGGVWQRQAGTNGSSMHTSPDVVFRNGSLDVTVVNITGTINDPLNEAVLDVESSRNESDARSAQVLTGECIRPDNVSVSVQSTFYQAWGRYLERETGNPVTYDHRRQTVNLTLEEDDLLQAANDEVNQVINLSNSSYMHNVTFTNSTISVDKDASNDYRVFVSLLNSSRMDMSRRGTLDNVTNATREPMDVVFVIDESGSMGNPTSSGSIQKIEGARRGARTAVAVMNMSDIGDRAGVVGYTTTARFLYVDGRYLSDQPMEVNATIERLDDGGSTDLGAGLDHGHSVLELRSTQSRQRHIFLLTDGENSPGFKCNDFGYFYSSSSCVSHFDSRTREFARDAAKDGIVLHTIAYGSGADTALLEDIRDISVAHTGEGTYDQAANASELAQIFRSTILGATQQTYIARIPVSTNFTGSGNVHVPQIAGDADPIATNTTNGHQFLNINDPTAPSTFAHSFAIGDGENITLQAARYDCVEWSGTGLTHTNTSTGTSYEVARCVNMTKANQTLTADNVSVYHDGEDVSHLMHNNSAWWQQNDSEALDPVVDDSTDELDLESNQALVVFNFTNYGNTTNKLFALFQVGLSEEDAQPESVVNIRVRNVRINEADDE